MIFTKKALSAISESAPLCFNVRAMLCDNDRIILNPGFCHINGSALFVQGLSERKHI